MTPLPKHAMQIPLFIYDSGGMIIGHDDPAIGYTEQQMRDYGKAEFERGLRAALEQHEQKPMAWMFQHEETGRIMCVEAQQVEGGFEKGNPRLKKIAPLYTAPPQQQAEPVHGDIRALRYRIFELEGENLGYKRMLDVAEAPPQRKPLTDEEIEAAFLKCNGKWDGDQWVIEDADFHPFARAIEQANGIKGEV